MTGSIAGVCLAGTVLMWGAVTLTLRDGRSLVGDIVAMDDTNVMVRTAAGLQTNAWQRVTVASLKATHPQLYARLMATAKQRQEQHTKAMQAKGLINVGGRWVDQQAYQARARSFVRLKVAFSEDRGHYVNAPRVNQDKRVKSRACHAVCTITLDGLHASGTHMLRAVYSCVATDEGNERTVLDHAVQFKHVICGVTSFETNVHSRSYTQGEEIIRFKIKDNRGTHTKQQKRKTGCSLRGWDVKIWLDDLLVYERACEGNERYYPIGN